MQQLPPMVSIRAVREAHGLTTPQLADRIREHGVQIHPDSLINVELGNRQASPELLSAWAKALKLRAVDIRQAEDLRELLAADPDALAVRESA